MKISDVYDNLDGKELFFLDQNLSPVKVKSIKKLAYSGKIYDVTVDNHIILVKRSGTPVWSGNSYNLVNSTTNTTNGTYTVILAVPSDGVYNITATAYDLAGNSNSTIASNITVDTTSPTTTPTAINNDSSSYTFNTWTNSNYVNVTLNCDDGSGV